MCFKLDRSENLPPLSAFSLSHSILASALLYVSRSLCRAARSLLISGLFLAARSLCWRQNIERTLARVVAPPACVSDPNTQGQTAVAEA